MGPIVAVVLAKEGFLSAKTENATNDTYALLPKNMSFVIPVCYEMQSEAKAKLVHEADPAAFNHYMKRGSCAAFGYSSYMGNDPVFKDAALFREEEVVGASRRDEFLSPKI